MQLPPSIIPLSRAMLTLSDGASRKYSRKLYWAYSQRILWTMQDANQALLMAKVTDPFALEILPTYDAEIEHSRTDILSVYKSDKPSDIKRLYAEYAQGEVIKAYDCHGEVAKCFARDVREMTDGKITVKSLAFASYLPCDTLEIRTTGIRLARESEWQAYVKYRKLQYFRPCQKPLPPSVLTPRSPEIP